MNTREWVVMCTITDGHFRSVVIVMIKGCCTRQPWVLPPPLPENKAKPDKQTKQKQTKKNTEQQLVRLVMAFSSLARILGECSTIHSPPALFFFLFFKVEISSRTLIPPPLYYYYHYYYHYYYQARDNPQWLSELRRMRPSVSWRSACEIVLLERFSHYARTALSA